MYCGTQNISYCQWLVQKDFRNHVLASTGFLAPDNLQVSSLVPITIPQRISWLTDTTKFHQHTLQWTILVLWFFQITYSFCDSIIFICSFFVNFFNNWSHPSNLPVVSFGSFLLQRFPLFQLQQAHTYREFSSKLFHALLLSEKNPTYAQHTLLLSGKEIP